MGSAAAVRMRGMAAAGFVVAALWCVAITPSTVAGGQLVSLLPVDESAKCPGFVEFKAQLAEIIRRKDAAALLSVLDPNLRHTFGTGNGRDEFKTQWLDNPDPGSGGVWTELADVLRLGGRCQGDEFVAPYVWTDWPNQFDELEFAAVVGAQVRVRERPSATAKVIGSVSFTVVPRDSTWSGDGQWEKVSLADGRIGYVAERFLRTPLDWRAWFVRRDGRWLITTFIAGD